MLMSFADLAAHSAHIYSRPVVVESGPLVMKVPNLNDINHNLFSQAARHPVICTIAKQQLQSSFVANDLFISPLDNLHVITGPNGAGKTIYTKQTALIVVLGISLLIIAITELFT